MKPTRARSSLAPDAGERNGGFFTQHAITRSVRDSAALLDVIAGAVPGDPYWPPSVTRPFSQEVGAPLGKLRIALQREAGVDAHVSKECRDAVDDTARLCESLGHVVTEVSPCYNLSELIAAAKVIWSSNLALALKGLGEGALPGQAVEPFTAYFAEISRSCSGEDYARAVQTVQGQGRALAKLLQAHDVLLTPTLAGEPVALGTFDVSSVRSAEEAEVLFYRQFRYSPFTMIGNASGNPAMSVPLAWTAAGLPLGSQFIGRFGDEATLFRLGSQLEEARPWFDRRPPDVRLVR
jgi:Asp-tRNA(Asn)/Glu-tRNA(Gln) amidotransferase A subunit family amidase